MACGVTATCFAAMALMLLVHGVHASSSSTTSASMQQTPTSIDPSSSSSSSQMDSTSGTSAAQVSPDQSSSTSVQSQTTSPAVAPGGNPSLSSVVPEFGPVSGGTKLAISGVGLSCGDGAIVVRLVFAGGDYVDCTNATVETSTQISCTTGASKRQELFNIRVSCNGSSFSWEANGTLNFTYKPDPQITDVYPAATILGGGMMQTVTGGNLASVSNPMIMVTYTMPGQMPGMYTEMLACEVVVDESNVTMYTCVTPMAPLLYNESNVPDRTSPISPNIISGTMEFIMDGINATKNLKIFFNPRVESFDPETMEFKANANNVITIKGSWPNMNYSSGEMEVIVGDMTCDDVRLDQSFASLTCRPPPLSKSIIRYGPTIRNTLEVVVTMGAMKNSVGHLHYVAVESFHVVMIVTIAVLAFIIALAVLCGVLTLCAGRRMTKSGYGYQAGIGGHGADDTASVHGAYGQENISGKRRRHGVEAAGVDEGKLECIGMQYQEGQRTSNA